MTLWGIRSINSESLVITCPMLDLKSSHKPSKDYFTELEQFEKHGHSNEMTVRNAFQDLLQTLSKKMQWQFIEEYPIKRKCRRDASVDGALLDQFSLPRAFWEAKDTKDDLPTEVQKKFEDGYPTTNILFWQPGRVILYQDVSAQTSTSVFNFSE